MAANIFEKINYNERFVTVLLAGLFLSVINAVLKPFVLILSLPAILLSIGFFVVVVNGLMGLLMSRLYDNFQVQSFGTSILAGLLMGLVS